MLFIKTCKLFVKIILHHSGRKIAFFATISYSEVQMLYSIDEVCVFQQKYMVLISGQCQRPEFGSNESTICGSLATSELETGFVRSREDYSDFNCKSIIEGVFAFDYRIVGSTGLCSSPFSLIKACQRQGSPLRDNSILEQTFGYCPNFQDQSILEDPNIVFGKANIWRCYGRWTDKSGTIWAAIAYDTNQLRFRYRCLTTRIDQQNPQDIYYWGKLVVELKIRVDFQNFFFTD